MSKMGSHDPFGHFKHKLWPKKGHESNCQFDSRPLQVRNYPNFLVCRWCVTYRWKALDKAYNLAWDLISIEVLHIKLWAFKVTGILAMGISRFSFGSLETKWHLGVSLVARHKIYYKGEGGEVVASPKFRLCWILWVHVDFFESMFACGSFVH
jgi:hypothetical protein